jgi:hypothetical protein
VAGIEEGWYGDGGSMEDRAGAARSRDGGGVPVARVQEGDEEVARKLPRVDVVLVVSSVRAKRERSGGMTVTEQRRWTGRPAYHSGGVSASGWRRTGREALVGCSGAGGAQGCGCGVAEVADDGEQDGGGGLATAPSGEEAEEAKCGRVRR